MKAFAAKCSTAMNDDFNVLIATLFDGVKAVNGAATGRVTFPPRTSRRFRAFQAFLRDVLGLASETSQNQAKGGAEEAGALLDLLVDMRTDAKTNKDWGTADKIRDVLATHGITIQDGKDGSNWSRG